MTNPLREWGRDVIPPTKSDVVDSSSEHFDLEELSYGLCNTYPD